MGQNFSWLEQVGHGPKQQQGGRRQTDSSGTILYLRALQGHSRRNLIDPSSQNNVLIPNDFFEYINHIGSAINLHSIMNSGLIPGGSKRQTVFFMPVEPMNKEHKDPDTVDLKAPRLAQYMHNAWKKHQNTVYWVDINLALKKGLKFYQTQSNAIILHNTLPAYCIPKVVRMETGEIIYEKVCFCVTRPPPKISFKDNWMQELGSEVAGHGQTPNKPKQTQIQLLEQGDLFRQNNRPVRVLRKSTNVSYLAAKAPMKKHRATCL